MKIGEVAEGAVRDCSQVREMQTGALALPLQQPVASDDQLARDGVQPGDIDRLQELVLGNPNICRLLERAPGHNPRVFQSHILDLERIDALHIGKRQLPKTGGGNDFEGIEDLELRNSDNREEGVVVEANGSCAALEVVEG